MAGIPRLASVAALAFVTATADAQRAPASVTDSAAVAGRRDGRAAAATRGVGRYAALGAVSGFIAGFAGIPLLLTGAADGGLLGMAAIFPVFVAVRSAGANRPFPPPDVDQRIADRPAAYRDAFRASDGQRTAQRRRRAATIGGVAGGVTGLATIAALVAYFLSNLDD
jgi:hypothetical protein